jgi:PAS domain S-box-containing protein
MTIPADQFPNAPATAPFERRPPVGVVAILLIAAAYLLGATFGRALAIPPGYASAFWVPAGIGLMAVLSLGRHVWIGVLLGSVANNTLVATATGVPWTVSLPVSIGIGIGAALQATVGAHLVRRFVGFPTTLPRTGDTLKLLALGGPAACLISSCIGVSLLTWEGAIPARASAFSWFNWWIGDSIGVLLVAPLWLVAGGQPRSVWRSRWRTVAIPVLGAILAALGVFFLVQKQEVGRIRTEFATRSDDISQRIQAAFDEDLVLLEAVRGHFEATPQTNAASFMALTRRVVARHGSLRAVEWAPWVSAADREAFELEARAGDAPGYRISDRNEAGALVPSALRPGYLPLRFSEPLSGNEAALGFDLASERERLRAVRQAAASGLPVLTEPLHVVQATGSDLHVLVFLPLYRNAAGSPAPPGLSALRGCVVGVISMRSLVEGSLVGVDLAGISFRIVDPAAAPGRMVAFERRGSRNGQSFERELAANAMRGFGTSGTMLAGGRTWRIESHPTLEFLENARTPMPWIVQSCGLLFAGLVGVLLLGLSGRNEQILLEVALRTRELSESNDRLTLEVKERARIEDQLRASEQRYRALIDQAPLMVAIARHGRFLYANSRYLEAHRIAAVEEVVGIPIVDHIAPSARAAFLERATRRVRGDDVERSYETIAVRSDGSEFPVLAYADVIELADGPAVIGFFEDVSERRAVEAARRLSEARFEAAFVHSALGIVIEDANANIQRVNPAMCELLEYTDAELKAKTLYDLTYPDDLAASSAAASDLWAGRISRYNLEKRYIRKGGSVVWVVIAVALIDEGPDRPRYLVSQVQDITTVKTATLALARSEQKLRGLYESTRLAIALTDMKGRFVEFNRAFEQLTGYSASELQLLDYWALTPRRYESQEAEQLRQLGAEGHYGPYEKEYIRKDGTLVPVQLRGMLLGSPDGESGIWSIIEDISERKRLEAKVAAESARSQLFLRNASDGVHILDERGRVVEASDSFCEMLGYTHEEVLGLRPVDWDARVSGNQGGIDFSDVLERGITRFETVHRRKNGTTFEVELHVELFWADGRRYMFCAARDITELRRLERALLDVVAREQQKIGYDLHDELGQVLTGVTMLAASLAWEEQAAGRPTARLNELEAMARRAISTCKAIAHGLSPLTYQDGNLVQALEEMIGLQASAGGAEIKLSVIQEAPVRLAREAKDHLYRIAQEAVTNARRHAAATRINVSLEIDADTVRMEIQDDGTGLIQPAGPTGGMGLGIMKFRAAIIGARLSIEPGSRAGTRVICSCRQGPAEPVEAAAS